MPHLVYSGILVVSRGKFTLGRRFLVDHLSRACDGVISRIVLMYFSFFCVFNREFCLLLTGTPLQNSTEELWALLHFADPVNFASKEAFTNQFGQLTSQEQVADLHKVLKPYLLRRVKEDVEKSLPPKEETILEVTLTPIQKTYYKAIYEKNTTFLFKGAKSKNAPSLMNAAMELRKVCNHPFLIGGAEERILADASATAAKEREQASTDAEISAKPQTSPKKSWKQLTGEQLIKSSGKMVLLDKLLPKLRSGGHKVLIFSQMVRVLDLLEDLLRLRDYKFERLDGSRSASMRSAAVDRFNKPSFDRFVMLLSTRAGGLGLNLVSADTVIIFDSDWNPQVSYLSSLKDPYFGSCMSLSIPIAVDLNDIFTFIFSFRNLCFLPVVYIFVLRRMIFKLWPVPIALDRLGQLVCTDF